MRNIQKSQKRKNEKEKRVQGEKPFSRKGFAEEVTWTAIVIIAALVSFVVLIAVWLFFQLPFAPGKPFSFDITFVDLVNRPYLVASSLGNAKFGDRIFFEHALEAAVVEGLENSNSENVRTLIEDYLDFYKLEYYSISVKKGGRKIFEINNLPKGCGIDSACVSKAYKSEAGACNIGRIETNFDCGSDRICCKEDKSAYEKKPDRFEIVPCGEDFIGICSAEPEFIIYIGSYLEKFPCGEGRIKIDDIADNCKDINNGKTPMCCAPHDVGTVSVGRAYSAQIPLLYRGEQAILEVAVE